MQTLKNIPAEHINLNKYRLIFFNIWNYKYMQYLLLSPQLLSLQDSKQNAASKFCKLIIFDLIYLFRHVTYIFDIACEKIVEFYDALVGESLSHHEDPRLCRTHCSVPIRKPK